MKLCCFLVILDLDFLHECDYKEAILCKNGIAKLIFFFKDDAADVLTGMKCGLVKVLCALTWEGKVMVMASLQSQRIRGEKKSPDRG